MIVMQDECRTAVGTAAFDASDAEEGAALVKPAITDVDDENDAIEAQLTLDEKLTALEETVCRHPLNREVLYRMLSYCAEERTLGDLEEAVASWPEFRGATQNQYRLAEHLVRAYGLEKIERDACGAVVEPADKEGLDEDALDDLVQSTSYRSTEAGRILVERHRPQARLVELLQLAPERADVYVELLEFTRGQPRAYSEIVELLRGRPVLQTVIDGVRHTMQPSVFVDKLERSGALVWNEGWCLTEEGDAFLQDLKTSE